MTYRITRRIAAALTLCALTGILSGCGGGGGGGNNGGGGGTGGNAIITGTVLLVSTNGVPDTDATITGVTASSGGLTVPVSLTDGTFNLSNVPTSATSLTIAVTQTAQTPANKLIGNRVIRIALAANQTANLGATYVGATSYDAKVTGQVVTQGTNGEQGVGGATVTIAGVQVNTSASPATLGQFTVSDLPVGLGSELGVLLGTVQANGFASYQITTNSSSVNFPNGLISFSASGGQVNNVGKLTILQPSGSTPAPPYTITGQVTVNGAAQSGQSVQLLLNGVNQGTTTTDGNGSYFFWVVAGTYTITARNSTGQFAPKSANVTLNSLDVPVTTPVINLGP